MNSSLRQLPEHLLRGQVILGQIFELGPHCVEVKFDDIRADFELEPKRYKIKVH